MKFDMEADALTNYGKTAEGTHEDLGTLIKDLIAAAEPLAKDFNGPAKAAFNSFHENSHIVTSNLKAAHGAIMGSASDQNVAFETFQADSESDIAASSNAQNYTNPFRGSAS